MFMLGTSWLWLSRWLRRWLTIHLFPRNIIYVDGKPYLNQALTAADKATIFAVHLVILGALASGIIFGFLEAVKLIYG